MNADRKLPFDLEEEGFIQRLQAREPDAWERLKREYSKPYLEQVILGTLAKYRLPADQLDDIEQKTWITAYTRIASFAFQQKGGLFYWLCSIQRNHIRNLEREPDHLPIEAADSPGSGAGSLRSVENQIISRERRREVLSALDLALEDLSPAHREIVLRRLVWKEPVSELAAAYGLKPASISQIVWSAKKKLSSYLLAPDLFFSVQNNKLGEAAKQWNP